MPLPTWNLVWSVKEQNYSKREQNYSEGEQNYSNREQNGTGTNVGPTNVGRYKGRTVPTSDLQTSVWYKRRTGTNIGLVETSDWYKRWTSTNVGRVHLQGKTSDFQFSYTL